MTRLENECFSKDYAGARRRFLAAAKAAHATAQSHEIPQKGPNGETLALDAVWLGPENAERVLVIGSGIHGVEGFAGSAIQLQFLLDQAAEPRVPGNFAFLLLHAINPYGFAYLRRANESNVDLNRNFVDHPGGHVENPGYRELDAIINPAVLTETADIAARIEMVGYIRKHGARALQEAISQGQYFNPRGVYYGGNREEASAHIVREIARTRLHDAARVAWLDIHTGLGDFGEYTMLYEASAGDEAFVRGRTWYGEHAQAEAGGEALSPKLSGTIDEGIRRELAGDCELTFFAQEFGTYDTTRVFWATRAENWLHHHADPDGPLWQDIKEKLREAFAPADQGWRRKVLSGGERVIEQAVRGLLGE